MNEIEQKVLLWIEKHLLLILLVTCTLLGIIIRLALKDITSADFISFLLPWYEEISENGISKQVGDYNLLYQMIIWTMTKLHSTPLYAYKMLSCFFDIVLAVTACVIVGTNCKKFKKEKSALAYCIVWLSPIVFLNSAAWAQCDAIYSTFCLLAILALGCRKNNLSLCLLGIAFAFKLQAVFVLPLFLFLYFLRRDFSVFRFVLIPLSMIGISLPAVLWGRSITEVFTIYANQTNTYQSISMNYPSVWLLLCSAGDASQYSYMKTPAICISACVLALMMFWWLQKSYDAEGKNLYIMAYLLIYTCVLFLPSMHERYGFLYEVLAIILAVMIPKMIPLSIALIFISMSTYGAFLFGNASNLLTLSWLNLVIYIASIFVLEKKLAADAKERAGLCSRPSISTRNLAR